MAHRRSIRVAFGDGHVNGRIDPKTGDLWTNIDGKNVRLPMPPQAALAPATNPHNVQPRVIAPKARGKKRKATAKHTTLWK